MCRTANEKLVLKKIIASNLLDWVLGKDRKNTMSSSMDMDLDNNDSIVRNVVVELDNNDSIVRNVVVELDNCTFAAVVVVAAAAAAVVAVVAVAFDMHQDIVDWYLVSKVSVSLSMNQI